MNSLTNGLRTSSALALLLASSVDCFSSTLPPPQDTTIRILLIHDVSVSDEIAEDYGEFLEDTWTNTAFSTGSPTTITLVNDGMSILYTGIGPGDRLEGDPDELFIKIDNFVSLPNSTLPQSNWREFYAADVVIGFTNSIEPLPSDPPEKVTCGAADQELSEDQHLWWGSTASFDPDESSGLDLRGRKRRPILRS